ncbi:hypothetical protein QUB28_23215 [Microcoleus sp. B4-C3]|uniref:hypothetical protein n=1 Tax=Microcoleus sp. B4-C2 TaxID=2818661 RepID=UPI002FD07B12
MARSGQYLEHGTGNLGDVKSPRNSLRIEYVDAIAANPREIAATSPDALIQIKR